MNSLSKKVFKFSVVIILFAGFFGFNIYSSAKDSDKLRVSFFDIGQGDSMFIQAPKKMDILIDGGPDRKILEKLSEAMPFYDKKIDIIIVSHPHADHITGLIDVIKRYNVEEIYFNSISFNSDAYLEFLKVAEERGIRLADIKEKERLSLGENIFLEIFSPNKNIDMGVNNTSLISKLNVGKNSFLFMGDAEKEIEELLMRDEFDLKANFLKVSHQGSADSSSKYFLKKVNPEIAVISVGKNNEFGHPSTRVIRRLERIGAKIYRTDKDGDVKIVFEKSGDYNIVVQK